MASIKVKCSLSSVVGKKGSVYYQITHERKVKNLQTEYRVFPEEWDDRRNVILVEASPQRKPVLQLMKDDVKADVGRLERIAKTLEAKGSPYTPDDIVEEYERYVGRYSMFNYMESLVANLKQRNRIATSDNYVSALSSFKSYREGKDIMLDAVTAGVIEGYEAYLHGRGVSKNTSSFYMRILRAAYNRAVEDGVIEQRTPFRHVYTGIGKTAKRAIPLASVSKMKKLDLGADARLDYARDMFLLSFYLRGMSFVDMAYLLKSDLRNGYITYKRRKTGQVLTIEWTEEMQGILDKYPISETEYLLPVNGASGSASRRVYRNVACGINRCLKRIAPMIGVSIPLTLYCARHSWASAAREKGVPLHIISEGMGHDSEITTKIYLASLDTSAVDRANSLILKSL